MDTPLHDHYVRSSNRLLFFDYDGTLVGFKPLPEQALPSKTVYRVLENLLADPHNTVVIISGRDRQFLDRVLGHLPVGLAAEHGFFIKTGQTWRHNSDASSDWKGIIYPILRAAVEAHPGSILEEKTSALVWHYRLSARHAETAARRLYRQLQPQLADMGLMAMPGHKVLEVRVAGVDKGQAAQHWLSAATHDFILAAGDDTTDEDLFAAMPPEAHTIKIGRSHTAATHRLPGPGALIGLLKSLT